MTAIINLITTLLRLLEDAIKRRREANEAREMQKLSDEYEAARRKLDEDPASWFGGHFGSPDRGLRVDVPASPPDNGAAQTESGDHPVQ